ncbi:MAG: DMT family transporter [Flavobacteriales bacterium]|nr:DMT family transporter [Flavobacteriales bacterium]PIV95180.1 MAG: EamA family transporter [Flavobacteriaceae bacterium CG17_big_fil_post_rev_8_21_14_2_50_33_15]PIY09420.1 MAG: EamA family transporter [Flavobacteriaceae bacterium CG_4_10_14_3_um_filter_33_47]PJB20477.1 MAG: EamA family transporter [Flavobacteriaceae bacterium CG_4_9_14_3_um_filter_33_16]NCP52332.1 DMT family transporter [Flavobacteriales bacterium]
MRSQHTNHLIELLIGTLFISTSGVLGKFIDMPTPVIIWFRCALGAIFLYVFCRYKKFNIKIQSRKDIPTVILSSVFLGIHWISYFYALKFSNVALGMLSLFTFPVITALLEPLFIKSKLSPIHIILGIIVIIGIYILAPEFDFESSQVKGVLLGLFSAVCYALRNLILKQHIGQYSGTAIMMYQILILSVLLLPFMFTMDVSHITSQFPYIIILALVTTAIGHSMFIHSLRYFSVSTASIINSLQPIFGIIMAYFFLKEIPSWNTFLGGSLILTTVIIESIRSRRP